MNEVKKRKVPSPDLKAKIGLEAIRWMAQNKTIQLSQRQINAALVSLRAMASAVYI